MGIASASKAFGDSSAELRRGRAMADALADKGQVEQRHDALAIQLRLEGKIEFIDTLDERQPGYF